MLETKAADDADDDHDDDDNDDYDDNDDDDDDDDGKWRWTSSECKWEYESTFEA